MKASSWGLVAPWRKVRMAKEEEREREVRNTTPQPDDSDLLPLALWNACATNPISISNTVDATMCNQGWPRGREEAEDEDEGSRSDGERSSLWTPGKPASCSFLDRVREVAMIPYVPHDISPPLLYLHDCSISSLCSVGWCDAVKSKNCREREKWWGKVFRSLFGVHPPLQSSSPASEHQKLHSASSAPPRTSYTWIHGFISGGSGPHFAED